MARRLIAVALRQIDDCVVKFFLAAEDHVVFQHFGSEPAPVKLGIAGAGAAVIPGIAGTGDRAVHQVDRIGYRHQHHTGPVIGAGALGPFSRLGFLAKFWGTFVVGGAICHVVIIGLCHDNLVFPETVRVYRKKRRPIVQDGWRLCQSLFETVLLPNKAFDVPIGCMHANMLIYKAYTWWNA